MTGAARAFVFALLVLVGAFVIVFAHGTAWRGEWNFTMDTAIGVTVLAGPIVGAVACWTCAEERRRAVLIDSTPRGWRAPLRCAASATLLGVGAFLVGLIGAFLATATVTHGGPLDGWMTLIVIPVLATNAVLGALVGRLWPIRVLVVLVAPGLFLLGGLSQYGVGPEVLRQGLATATLAGTTWRRDVVLGQALVMVALVVAAVALFAVLARVRLRASVLVGTAGVLAACVAGWGLPSDYEDLLRVSSERPTACAGSEPRVCLAPSNRRALAAISRQMQRAARPLLDAGADVPGTYVATLPLAKADPGAGVIVLTGDANEPAYRLGAAADQISLPAPCPAWSSERGPSEDTWEARGLVVDWLLAELGEPAVGRSVAGSAWLKTVPPEEAEKVVVDLFDRLRSCELDEITLPWQG